MRVLPRSHPRLVGYVAFAASLLVAYLVCGHGIPQLRQDWTFSPLGDALASSIGNLYEPWLQMGIGEPQAYPTIYLIGFLLRPLAAVPPTLFVWLLVSGIAFLVASGGAAIGRSLAGPGSMARIACALFALFNPWVYTEFVAGHPWMILAYGLLLWLISEVLAPQPRRARLVVLCALLVCQIEFFVLALIPIAIWLVRTKRLVPLAAIAIAALPIAFGIAAHYDDIRGTPYLLEWQRSQSLDILSALTLRGYFTHYAQGFASIAFVLWAFAAASAAAAVLALRGRHPAGLVLVLGFGAVAFATGTKWILEPAYAYVVLHVPESGVLRELYDVIGLAAIAYTVGIASLASARRWVGIGALVAACLLIIPWLTAPPFGWFAPADTVRAERFPGTSDERIALFPAVQPLQPRRGVGSGYDPDMFVQSARAIPVNVFFPRYPQSAALALARTGDFSQLDALGVRYVVSRPWLVQNEDALRQQVLALRSHGAAPSSALPRSQVRTDSYPLLGLLSGFPDIATVGASAAANSIFFGDAPASGDRSRTWFEAIPASRVGTKVADDWIDARLAILAHPATATRFGGAFTTSAVPLDLPVAPYVLAWTSGRILDREGRVVASSTPGLQWWPLERGATSVRCIGQCAVVGVGNPPKAPTETSRRRPDPVFFRAVTPWLLQATLPAHGASTLRWTSRYERSWTLFGVDRASHVRLDEVLNGWMLPAGPSTTVSIVNLSAAVQMLLEIVAFVAIGVLIVLEYVRDMRREQA